MMTLGDVSSVYVLGEVDEADIGQVYLGQPARIVVESFKEKRFEGQVTKISPLGVEEENVTTFEVRVSIDNPGGELKANMSANAEIILEDERMSEDIKWKSPTFIYEGNMASFNPRTKAHVSLMFHTGASIPGSHSLLEGGGETARYARFQDLADVEAKADLLRSVVGAWCRSR